MSRITLSCCSWSYHKTLAAGRMHFEEWLKECVNTLQVAGVDIIADQVPQNNRRYWIETKKRCTDLGLAIVILSPVSDFGKTSKQLLEAQVDKVRRWIDIAWLLGAPRLRLFAGWAPKEKREQLWPQVVRSFRQLARPASQAGVTIAIEPHNHGGFCFDSRTTLRLIHDVDSPWVRINLDTGNYQDKDLIGGLRASLPFAAHVVAKIHGIKTDGQDKLLNYGEIFSLLKREGYHGFVTVEYEGEQDERSTVPRAVAMLREHLEARRL